MGQHVHLKKGLETANGAIAFGNGAGVQIRYSIDKQLIREVSNVDQAFGRLFDAATKQGLEIFIAIT